MIYRKPGAKAVAVENDVINQAASPFAGSSLVPMLVAGLALTLAGMIAVLVLS
jgi:hypothetical protein